MKHKYFLTLCTILLLSQAAIAGNLQRPKIGLVLSGGGARGFAHIGVLKMLDSLQIPVDYVAGTSMGGIVGALYAIGYTGQEIEKIALETEWETLFSDSPARSVLPYLQKQDDGQYQVSLGLKGITPVTSTGLISGQNISLKFSGLTLTAEYIRDFDRFPIPFRCVAADLISGNQVVLRRGSLSKAMRSTMSIPTIFSPVEWGDSLLVDGGILNNLPVDIVREMGAEYVIAIDVGQPMYKRADLKKISDIITQTINLPLNAGIEKNARLSDMLIVPELRGFTSSDFFGGKISKIITVGDRAGQSFKAELSRLKSTYNLKRFEISESDSADQQYIVYGISIAGNTSIAFNDLNALLGINPGQPFDPVQFNQKLSALRLSGLFKSVDYEIRPLKQNKVKLNIKVEERKKPLIHKISIQGNTILPFKFIYRLLGLNPLQVFDGKLVEKRINELFGLGYFETINYEIEPVGDDRVHLIIRVKEGPLRRLKLGFHYDDNFKGVASAAVTSTNHIMPGLRVNLQMLFAGLTHFNFKAAYPSRGLNAPLFPYVRFEYKDRLVNIFEEHGRKIAAYNDRFTAGALGVTFLMGKMAVLDLEYNIRKMNVDPSVAFNDPLLFPSWDDQIRSVQLDLSIDENDDVFLPNSGLYLKAHYEDSRTDFGSDISFKKYNIMFDQYITPSRNHTFRLNGFYSRGSDQSPVYVYDYRGGPDSFVGMDYHQLVALNFAIARLDYRFRYKKDIYFKLIGNGGRIFKSAPQVSGQDDYILGYGVGVKFLSIIGPFEFIYSRGPRSYSKPLEMRNMFYFEAGFKLR